MNSYVIVYYKSLLRGDEWTVTEWFDAGTMKLPETDHENSVIRKLYYKGLLRRDVLDTVTVETTDKGMEVVRMEDGRPLFGLFENA